MGKIGLKRPDVALRNKSLESKERGRQRFLLNNPNNFPGAKERQSLLNASKRPEIRKKLSELRGHRNFKEGIKHTEATKEKMRQKRIAYMCSGKVKKKDTSIELLIQKELETRGIYFLKQFPLCGISVVDFYIPKYKVVIYCDGEYWHNYPLGKSHDENQNKILKLNGYNVYRFWEREILKSPRACIDIITIINNHL